MITKVIDMAPIDRAKHPTYAGIDFPTRPAALRQLLLADRILSYYEGRRGTIGIDIGSKYAHLRRILKHHGVHCLRLDISRREDEDGLLIGNGRRLPFADSSVDFLVTAHVMAHIDVLDEFLAESRRVLKPGGRRFILQNNGYGWWKFWGYTIVRNDRRAHHRTFSLWGITRWLADAGLAMESNESPYYFYLHSKYSRACYRFDRRWGSMIPQILATQWLMVARKPRRGDTIPKAHPVPDPISRFMLGTWAFIHACVLKLLELAARRYGRA